MKRYIHLVINILMIASITVGIAKLFSTEHFYLATFGIILIQMMFVSMMGAIIKTYTKTTIDLIDEVERSTINLEEKISKILTEIDTEQNSVEEKNSSKGIHIN